MSDTLMTGDEPGRLTWVRSHMPILAQIRADFARSRPFDGLTIGICLHVEAKTAIWVETLLAGGAKIALTGSPGTTQDDIAAHMATWAGVEVWGQRDDDFASHMEHCRSVLRRSPDLVADNGGDLHGLLAGEFQHLLPKLRGATEETTTGGYRLREDLPAFGFPTWIINDTAAKRIVENRYGVGSSVVDGLMRATNLMLHGKRVVVLGYGWCGAGVAQRLRGLGAHVVVVDPAALTRLEAHLEGFETAEIAEALPKADMVITVTGRDGVLGPAELALLPNGAVLANAGHFASEIDADALAALTVQRRQLRPSVEELRLTDGRVLWLLARGNPVNLAAGDGNPIEIMDLGLALQSLSLAELAGKGGQTAPGPHPVPPAIEADVARRALNAWVRKI